MVWRSAVLSPENEKLHPGWPTIGRGRAKRVGIAAARGALDRRPAGKAEPQHLRRLVVGLAERIVERGAEAAVAAHAQDHQQLAMAARDQEQQVGKLEPVLGSGSEDEARGQRMRLEMVDREERQAMHRRDRLGGDQPDQQAADQTRSGGRGDARELGESQAGFAHDALDQMVEDLDVRPRRDLRHDAAVGGMARQLAVQRLGAHPALGVDQGDPGLVAAGLDAEHDGRAIRARFCRS